MPCARCGRWVEHTCRLPPPSLAPPPPADLGLSVARGHARVDLLQKRFLTSSHKQQGGGPITTPWPSGPSAPGVSGVQVCACCGDVHAQDTGERASDACAACTKAPLCGGCCWAHMGPSGQFVDLCCPCHGRPDHSPREQPMPYNPRPPWVGFGWTSGTGTGS